MQIGLARQGRGFLRDDDCGQGLIRNGSGDIGRYPWDWDWEGDRREGLEL